MPKKITSILSIAGSDSSAGAGIQADIKAAALCNVYATTAVTAVTAQSTSEVKRIIKISPENLALQLDAAISDQRPDAIKIGMVGSLDNAKVIEEYLKNPLRGIPVVIDPVINSTSGKEFSDCQNNLISFYSEHLLCLATVITPNVREACELIGKQGGISSKEEQVEMASRILDKTGCKAVVLKGGHTVCQDVYDILIEKIDSERIFTINKSERINCHNLHGTGCTFSTILACSLAKGNTVKESFMEASILTKKLIANSMNYEYGHSSNGPLNHFNYIIK